MGRTETLEIVALVWQEVCSNSSTLQPWSTGKHLRMHNLSNVETDGVQQQQKATSGSTTVSQEQDWGHSGHKFTQTGLLKIGRRPDDWFDSNIIPCSWFSQMITRLLQEQPGFESSAKAVNIFQSPTSRMQPWHTNSISSATSFQSCSSRKSMLLLSGRRHALWFIEPQLHYKTSVFIHFWRCFKPWTMHVTLSG